MRLGTRQLGHLERAGQADFHTRLDGLLAGRVPTYARLPRETRLEGLARITRWARSCGIREELYIGLFALLVVQRGPRLLEHPEARTILADTTKSSATKVYQCYAFAARVPRGGPLHA